MTASTKLILTGALAVLLCTPAYAGTIHAPVATQLTDGVAGADLWWLVADDDPSGTTTLTVDVYTEFGGSISINGLSPQVVGPGAHSISLDVPAGSENYFEFSGGLWNYKPTFNGVSRAYITEDANSPNDLVNQGAAVPFYGSNLALGYAGGDPNFPIPGLGSQWFYDLEDGDLFSWSAFFDDFPAGDDAAYIEILDATGSSQGLFAGPGLLGGAGFTFTDTVGAGEGGFWSVILGAINGSTVPGHYLMDVTVNNDAGSDASNRHYLLPPGSTTSAPPVPEPATMALFAMGLAAGVLRRRHTLA